MILVTTIALLLALFILFLDSTGHIVGCLIRKMTGQKMRARPVKLLGGFASFILVLFGWVSSQRDDLAVYAQFEYLALGALSIFILTLIYQVYRTWRNSRHGFRAAAWVSVMVSLVAMPIAAAFFTSFGFGLAMGEPITLARIVEPTAVVDRYYVEIPASKCATRLSEYEMSLRSIFSYGKPDQLNDWEKTILFWGDQTLKGMLLDIPEVFDCRFSPMAHKPDENPGFAIFIIFYRLAASIIFLTLIIWPFASWKKN
ncbi:MAG: hypothetical protein ACWA5L_03460 [bacterium]